MDAERRVERETFEKWGAVIYPFRRHDFDADIYAEPGTQAAWEAWQRAWSESRAALAAPRPAPVAGVWVRPERDFVKWAEKCVNGPETLRAIQGAYGQGLVDAQNAAPAPVQAGEAVAYEIIDAAGRHIAVRRTLQAAKSWVRAGTGWTVRPLVPAPSRPRGAT